MFACSDTATRDDPAILALVKPGESVSYTVSMPDDPELASVKQIVNESFQGALDRAEMKVAVSPQGTQVLMEFSLKKLENAELSKIGDFRATETMPRKELHWTIRHRQGNQEIWKVDRVVGNHDQFLVRLANGEAAETGADRQMAEAMVMRLKGLTLLKFLFGPAAHGTRPSRRCPDLIPRERRGVSPPWGDGSRLMVEGRWSDQVIETVQPSTINHRPSTSMTRRAHTAPLFLRGAIIRHTSRLNRIGIPRSAR